MGLTESFDFIQITTEETRISARAPGQKTDQCCSGYCFTVGSEKDFKHENHSFKPNVTGSEKWTVRDSNLIPAGPQDPFSLCGHFSAV